MKLLVCLIILTFTKSTHIPHLDFYGPEGDISKCGTLHGKLVQCYKLGRFAHSSISRAGITSLLSKVLENGNVYLFPKDNDYSNLYYKTFIPNLKTSEGYASVTGLPYVAYTRCTDMFALDNSGSGEIAIRIVFFSCDADVDDYIEENYSLLHEGTPNFTSYMYYYQSDGAHNVLSNVWTFPGPTALSCAT